MRYLIKSWKLLSENPLAPPEKIHSLLFTNSPLQIQKCKSTPFCKHWKNFWSTCRKGGGEDTVVARVWLHKSHWQVWQLQQFFQNILQKYYQLPILGILDMSSHFHQKETLMFILQKLWCLSAYQKRPPFLTSFLGCCKDIANLLLWVIWECLIMSINNDNTNLVGNFDAQSVEINF